MASKMESILDRPSNTIERQTKPLPRGSYLAMVQGQPRFDKSSNKGTEFVEFSMKIMEAQEDVDEDDLKEYLTDASGKKKSLTDVVVRNTYYLTENSTFRLVSFLDHLDGITPDKVDEVEETSRQRIAEATGKSCIINIRHEPWQNGEGVSARVASTAIAE